MTQAPPSSSPGCAREPIEDHQGLRSTGPECTCICPGQATYACIARALHMPAWAGVPAVWTRTPARHPASQRFYAVKRSMSWHFSAFTHCPPWTGSPRTRAAVPLRLIGGSCGGRQRRRDRAFALCARCDHYCLHVYSPTTQRESRAVPVVLHGRAHNSTSPLISPAVFVRSRSGPRLKLWIVIRSLTMGERGGPADLGLSP